MGTDVYALLDCRPPAARKALGFLQGGAPRADDVLAVGKRACLVATPHKWPRPRTPWDEITTWVTDLAQRAGHKDERGVLVVPDEGGLEIQLAARSYAHFLELTGDDGIWLRRGAAAARSAAPPSASPQRRRVATLPRAGARAKLACFALPEVPEWLSRRRPPVVSEMAALPDGAGLLVVREQFADVEALLKLVVFYPNIAALATDSKGLLCLPGSAFDEARELEAYGAVVARFGKRGGGGVWLKVADRDALVAAVHAATEEAWKDPAVAATAYLAEARRELRRGGS